MITRLVLKNFTCFSDLGIDFSPKINVIIGENGAGKTHLLKAAYCLCSAGAMVKGKPDFSRDDLERALTSKFLRIFLPLDDKLGKLRRTGAVESAQMEARFANDEKVVANFHTNSKALAIQDGSNYEKNISGPVFNSLYEKFDLSFDQTYQDICLLLELPEVRKETRHEKSNWAMSAIEGICRGRFVFYGGGMVTFKTESAESCVTT
jgi:AAA15 family ATPase/GTPase